LLVVIALHCAVIADLVVSSKARPMLHVSPAPIELLFFPPSPSLAAAAASRMPTFEPACGAAATVDQLQT